jgi:sorting nexin-1/2
VFKKTHFRVHRDFSDFVNVHGKLIVKYLPKGIIIPGLPENNSSITPNDIIERRRAQLERYVNHLVRNKTLVCDSDFVMFLELPRERPKITNNLWRDLLSTSTIKTQEGDWFDEKQVSEVILKTMKVG